MKSINKIIFILLSAAAIAGCKKGFLERPSTSQISSTNFYKTTGDLRLATASLYGGSAWSQWHNGALIQLGDILSGTANRQWIGDWSQLYTRTITANNGVTSSGWTGLYNVIGQCNGVINAIQQQASASIPAADKNAAIAEAKFIRAVAYYHLAVYWGAVPIIEDNSKLIKNPLLDRNIVSDVYKFIINDLTYAAQNLPITGETGRVTTWSAQGMLGKVYLTMAGLGKNGARDQALLDLAIKYAGNVCHSNLTLLGQNDPNHQGYYNLFRSQFNDNPESLFALQWAPGLNWGNGNRNLNFSPSNDINPQKSGAWAALYPSYDLYKMYTTQDSIRRKATIMLTGDKYPELNAAGGGYKSDGVYMKKHIIGNEKDNNSPTMDPESSPEHNAILRLADVYLVYAEAILGNNTTTTDAEALKYFNLVRTRAGVAPALVLDGTTILKERRIEFAFEGQYWMDLVRWSYYQPQQAVDWINKQDRAAFSYDATTHIAKRDTTVPAPTLPATISSFTIQIPGSEITMDPKLLDPPVPYY